MLPKDYPRWELVYYYYCKWWDNGTIEDVHENLRNQTRKRAGRQQSPSLAIIDSQSRSITRREVCREILMAKKMSKEENGIFSLILWVCYW